MAKEQIAGEKSKGAGAGKKRAPTLYLIIAMKLAKGVALLLLAAGVYRLHKNNLPEQFNQALEFFHIDPEKKFFTELAKKISQITPANVVLIARGTGLYSLFSLVEGFGLLFRVSWAGWLAIGESAFFIPIEMFELTTRGFSYGLFCILALNILIVWYLFQNRKRLFHHHDH